MEWGAAIARYRESGNGHRPLPHPRGQRVNPRPGRKCASRTARALTLGVIAEQDARHHAAQAQQEAQGEMLVQQGGAENGGRDRVEG